MPGVGNINMDRVSGVMLLESGLHYVLDDIVVMEDHLEECAIHDTIETFFPDVGIPIIVIGQSYLYNMSFNGRRIALYIEGILPKGPYLPFVSITGRALWQDTIDI